MKARALLLLFLLTAWRVPEVGINEVRSAFNRHPDSVRLVALLSPTCPECRAGYQVIRKAFRKFGAKRLKGIIVWMPMLRADRHSDARLESARLADPRVFQGWDQERKLGRRFAERLKLTRIAWDVYLLYPPGTTWEGDLPPAPSFWMHQLNPDSGASPKMCLNEPKLLEEIRKLLAGDGAKHD